MVGGVAVGGGAPISVQSMTNTRGVEATRAQILALREAGCDIVRVAVPDEEAAGVLAALVEEDLGLPIVADIHFDYRLALRAADAGAAAVRVNPGNIGDESRVREVASRCRAKGIPIRVGVNGGSLEKKLLSKYGGASAEALAESALNEATALERADFTDIVLSVKSSSPAVMAAANRILAEKCDYPLHLGVTEAGTRELGVLKGAAGVGGLLLEGIGDTIRLSLTDDPVEEVRAGVALLRALDLREEARVTLISCPTCGRTRIDLIPLAQSFEQRAQNLRLARPVKAALMGCVVNGPGEAADADVGVAGGVGEAVLFREGKIVRKIPEEAIVEVLLEEVQKIGGSEK